MWRAEGNIPPVIPTSSGSMPPPAWCRPRVPVSPKEPPCAACRSLPPPSRANGKIEIDSRSFEQMRIARGSGICAFGQFNYLTDAQNFARRNNFTPGSRCSCR
ncbi:MAG: hypothetical protein FD152_4200 [Xanthobacteraceae bacterium]|nr:MAG: hypothetical protein FD152_4200 [Xanthobacteraceae bacterium]